MYWSGRNKLGLKILAIGLSLALALPGFISRSGTEKAVSDRT